MVPVKKLETATNIASLLVCVSILAVLMWRFVIPHEPAHEQLKVPIGRHVQLPEVNWAGTRKTAVLVISTECHSALKAHHFFDCC